MIACVGLGESGELSACCPVKLSAVYDDAAKGGSVSSDELGSGVNYDVSAVLKGTDEIRSSESVIYNKRNLM